MHEDDSFTFSIPHLDDRTRIAEMLSGDMHDLGLNRSTEELLEVADLILSDQGRSSFCRVVRPKGKDEAVGLVLANVLFSPKFAGKALWLENLYVDPQWRRNGLGRRLVEYTLDWAETHGIKGIDLEAYQGNTPAAILYRSLGFERLSRERFWFDFNWIANDDG